VKGERFKVKGERGKRKEERGKRKEERGCAMGMAPTQGKNASFRHGLTESFSRRMGSSEAETHRFV